MKLKSGILYTSFKYAMYALLLINTFYFFDVNSAAEAATHKGGARLGDLIVAYADAIDSASWLVLLLLFEIETSYTPTARTEKWAQPLIAAGTMLCWAVILYSFYGYYGGLEILPGFAPYAGPDPCLKAGTDALFAVTLDNYAPLDEVNCALVGAGASYSASLNMFAPPENLRLMRHLIWTDVINAAVWIIVAAMLEFEIFRRAAGRATPKLMRALTIIKAPFWIVLGLCCIYWWVLGEPVDAWDAFLWIAAFFFIEVNMMAKHEDRARQRAAHAAEQK